ncbi:MAG: hypothetical protein M0R37_15550 [Bacteroidales bacterium]|nr:hypothetical protein [Bacteroidales bacterium]
MGRRETREGREARRVRNGKRRQEEQARNPDKRPMTLRRMAERERTMAKIDAAFKAWELVLAAVAPLAPGPPGFRYVNFVFTDPIDAKAYNAEFEAALVTAGEEGKTPIGRWRVWAGVAMVWLERRKMRPIPVPPGELPRGRAYKTGEIRLMAPTDPDMIALLKRKVGIEDKPAKPDKAEPVATSTEPAADPLEFQGIPEASPPAATEPAEPSQPPTQGVDGSA